MSLKFSAEWKGQLQLHFVVFIWGFTAILGELISLPADQLVWHRMLIAALALIAWLKFTSTSWQVTRRTGLQMLATGAITGLHWISFFHAVKISNVSITLACLSSTALFTSLLEPLFYRRKIRPREILFGLISIAGISIIFDTAGNYREGIIVALISAVLAALFAIINGIFAKNHRPSVITTYEMIGGVLAISIYLLGQGKLNIQLFGLASTDWLYLGILGLVCTAYAFIVSVKVLQYLSPYTVVLTINLEPVYGIILAFLIFGEAEKMDWPFYVGTLLILGSVIANGVLRRRGISN
jgi:drug/metabolite transporter (DMT)-like permease